jgi:hypothetical protein
MLLIVYTVQQLLMLGAKGAKERNQYCKTWRYITVHHRVYITKRALQRYVTEVTLQNGMLQNFRYSITKWYLV